MKLILGVRSIHLSLEQRRLFLFRCLMISLRSWGRVMIRGKVLNISRKLHRNLAFLPISRVRRNRNKYYQEVPHLEENSHSKIRIKIRVRQAVLWWERMKIVKYHMKLNSGRELVIVNTTWLKVNNLNHWAKAVTVQIITHFARPLIATNIACRQLY